jgi:hypothetical protein
MAYGWNAADGKTEVLREKPVLVPLRLPQIPHGLSVQKDDNLCEFSPELSVLIFLGCCPS